MTVAPGALRVLPLVLAVALRLFPPGHADRVPVRDTTQRPLPAALAHGSSASDRPFGLHAVVGPAPAHLGQQLVYRGWVLGGDVDQVNFAPPEAGGAFTWGTPRSSHAKRTLEPGSKGYTSPRWYYPDSAWIEVPLQVFATGIVAIPGPRVVIRTWGNHPIEARLPTVHLLVLPVLTAADSAATLRPVRGPLAAPWWERVPWRYVVAGALVLAAAAALVRWWRRRRRKPAAPVTATRAPLRPAVDPALEALMALAKLRAEHLPELGHFDAHAQALTRILRRYLEARLVTPRPGDTSTELVQRLRASRLAADDVLRLEGLLGLWDRVKFARAPLDLAEAERCETAVEALVRRAETPREVA